MRKTLAVLLMCPVFAASAYTIAPDGSSSSACSFVAGVYTCTDSADLPSQYCETVNGVTTCSNDAGSKSQAVGTIDGTNAATVAQSELQVHKGMLSDALEWLKGALLFIPRWIWSGILGALGALIKAIPVPDFFATWASSAGAMSSSVVWFLDLVQFKFGVVTVGGALLLRWLLRRIPLIG